MPEDEIEVPVWVKRGKRLLRRDALNGDDPDHTYNYLKARGIRPEDYGVKPGPVDPAARVTDAIEAAYEARCLKAERAVTILRDAVQFYANRNHWMGLTESSETETVLIAHGNTDSFDTSKDGWSMAEWAFRQTAKI